VIGLRFDSSAASGSKLLLLGQDNVMEARVLTWLERVKALGAAGNMFAALALAMDFYEVNTFSF